MRLTPPEDRLEPADELESSTSVLCGHGIGRGARQAERRQQCRKPADQAGEYQETSAPHGAQSYQTLETVGALLTNPLDPLQRSRRCRLCRRRPPMAGIAPIASGEGRNRTGDTTVFSRVLYQLSYLARRAAV